MIKILNLMYLVSYSNSIGLKIKMIRSLKIMGEMLKGERYTLKDSKIFIEENWDFKK